MDKGKIFSGGTVVLPNRTIKADLYVRDGRVAGVLTHQDSGEMSPEWDKIDCSGKLLFPGVVDPHVHMWDPSPLNYREDWYCGTCAAAAGGITTVIDMPLSVPPVVDEKGFAAKYEVASENAVVDFAFWGGLIPDCVEHLKKMDGLGCVAYKGFMSFANPDYPQITDAYLVRGMEHAAKFGGLIGLHAENAEVCDMGGKRLSEQACTDEAMHDEARPWWAELEAIQRAALFAKTTGARLYICHMTIPEGAEFLREQRLRGLSVAIETCPHYLLFDRTILREKKSFAKCNPPLRTRERVERLWEYIFDGTIDTIGSDHGPYTDAEKIRKDNFWEEYAGFGGYDAMLPALLTEGVRRRGLPLWRLAQLLSENPARQMGLYPQKGSLLPGADADIAVIDLQEQWRYDGLLSLSKTKSSKGIYQDMEMYGRVQQTYVRGELVYDTGRIQVQSGFGQFQPKAERQEG